MNSLRSWIRKALTRTEYRRTGRSKKIERIELPPSERLVYGLYFAFLALILLTILETIHIIFLHAFSTEIFAAITALIGTITGIFLTSR